MATSERNFGMIIKKCDICGKKIDENRPKFIISIQNDKPKCDTIASTIYFDACDDCLKTIKGKIADIYKLANI